MPPVSLLSQQLNSVLTENMQDEYQQYRTYVDSYTKWKAESFSACLQKELTHDIHVDFKSAAHMKARVDDEENISNYGTQCSIYEWIIL